jgi:hypothetical protein
LESSEESFSIEDEIVKLSDIEEEQKISLSEEQKLPESEEHVSKVDVE